MKKQMNRRAVGVALLLTGALWGCDQLAVTGVDQLEPGAASLSKGGKPGSTAESTSDPEPLEPRDFGLAWPF